MNLVDGSKQQEVLFWLKSGRRSAYEISKQFDVNVSDVYRMAERHGAKFSKRERPWRIKIWKMVLSGSTCAEICKALNVSANPVYTMANRMGVQFPESKRRYVDLTCCNCGKIFERRICQVKKQGEKFCSWACQQASKAWTDSEIQYLKDNVGKKTHAEIGKEIGKTQSAVSRRCRISNIKTNDFKHWTAKELKFIVERPSMSRQSIANHLDRSYGAVCAAIREYQLRSPSRPGFSKKQARKIQKLYLNGHSDIEIGKLLGVHRKRVQMHRKENNWPANNGGQSRSMIAALHKNGERFGYPQARSKTQAKILMLLDESESMTREQLSRKITGEHKPWSLVDSLRGLIERGVICHSGRKGGVPVAYKIVNLKKQS